MNVASWNIAVGWCGMGLGALLGMTFGLWAADRHWAGGYGSFRRQAMRLGHVAAFALGIINVLYGVCGPRLGLLPPWALPVGGLAMIAGALLMPLVCLLSAWREPCKYLFPIPASCVTLGVAIQVWGWILLLSRGG